MRSPKIPNRWIPKLNRRRILIRQITNTKINKLPWLPTHIDIIEKDDRKWNISKSARQIKIKSISRSKC